MSLLFIESCALGRADASIGVELPLHFYDVCRILSLWHDALYTMGIHGMEFVETITFEAVFPSCLESESFAWP